MNRYDEDYYSSLKPQPRWMNELDDLKYIVSIKEGLNSLPDIVSESDTRIFEECANILQIFENFMVLLDEQPAATTGLVIPSLCEIHQALTDMEISHTKELVSGLLDTVKELLDYYKNFTDFQFACILDPRFKSSLVDSGAVISLQKRGSTLKGNTLAAAPKPVTSEPLSKKPRFFAAIKNPRSSSSLGRSTAAIEVELQTYCDEQVEDEEVNPANYWLSNKHRFPLLAQLARHYLTLPTNAEHLLQLAGLQSHAVSTASPVIDDEDFHRLIFIRSNKSHDA